MYRQFSYYTSINTSERIKKKSMGSKINCNEMFNNILYKSKENNWKKYYRRLEYFSKVPLLISDMTSSNFYTNTKCCTDFHIYKKKDKRKLKLNNYHLNNDIFN